MYIGLRQKREKSEKYDQLIDELICALRERFASLHGCCFEINHMLCVCHLMHVELGIGKLVFM